MKTVIHALCHEHIKMGLGDYLKGCRGLLKIQDLLAKNSACKIHVEFDISNHPFSSYLKNQCKKNFNINDVKPFFLDHELFLIPSIVKTCKDNTLIVSTNCVNFHKNYPQDTDYRRLQKLFVPTSEFKEKFENLLAVNNIIAGSYTVLSIRGGDPTIHDPSYSNEENLGNLFQVLQQEILNIKDPIVLICDSPYIKSALLKKFNFINFNAYPVVNTQLNKDSAKDTLIDFFTILNSKNIIGTVSNFCLEASIIFNIPIKILHGIFIKYSECKYPVAIPIRTITQIIAGKEAYKFIEKNNFLKIT